MDSTAARVWRGSLLAALVLALACTPAAADTTDVGGETSVLVTRLDGPLSPVSATELLDAQRAAEQGGAAALLVEIDTPGGLITSMRQVVEGFLSSDVPIITYVTPSGARAASAGALIAMSGHVAAMAPATTIGAATPVTITGGEVEGKAVNDAAAFAEAVAGARGRDVGFARAAVVEGRSITAEAAVAAGAIDLVADDRLELLGRLDGTPVTLDDGSTVTLDLASAVVEERTPGLVRSFLARLVDPNLTFVLLALGTLALLVEFAVPGIGAGGITGVILLLLGGFSLSLLPTNLVGVLLLVLAVALLIGELFVPGTGVMAAGGAIALVLAGLFLFDDASGVTISAAVLAPVSAVVLIATVALTIAVRNAQALPRRLDDDQLVNRVVEVLIAHGDQGQVMLNGERWHVRTDDPPLERGQWVRVLEREGLTLLVVPEEE